MTIFEQVRKKYKLTQQKMADELNISLQKYRNIEKGYTLPEYNVLAKVLYIRNKKGDRSLAKILMGLIKEGWYE